MKTLYATPASLNSALDAEDRAIPGHNLLEKTGLSAPYRCALVNLVAQLAAIGRNSAIRQ